MYVIINSSTWNTEGTAWPSIHTCTHPIMSTGAQLVLIDHKLHHFSMACFSCMVEHCVTIDVSAVEQRLHHWSQVLKCADMATLCSQVKSILSNLKERNAYRRHIRTYSKYDRYIHTLHI